MSSIKRELSANLFKNLTERFEFHGKNIYGNTASENNSPLYSHLCLMASNDREILTLVANSDFSTQVTNLLFAAVQYLLLNDAQHSLAAFYPNFTATPLPVTDAYPHFRAFCMEHKDEITKLVESRRVQTNEVRRCTGLLPAFKLVAHRGKGKSLSLIEIGASAGLLMLWDFYSYDYKNLGQVESSLSNVWLNCNVLGTYQPSISGNIPAIVERIGLELDPIDINDENEIRWLEALIWPEHKDRRTLLKAALGVAQKHPQRIVRGNAVDTLPDVLAEISSDTTLCVFHSYTFAQMPGEAREQILDQLIEYSKQQDLFRISQEWLAGWEKPRIEFFYYHQGKVQSELLAYPESHGRSLEWLQS